jgi:protein gp37
VSDRTKIPWAHATLNLWYACTAVSRGCLNCYARRQSPRLGVDFDGPIVYAPADRWDKPLRWRKPRRIFVNSMSDTLHQQVPAETIARVWALAAVCPRHQFLILTKRHGRLASLLGADAAAFQVLVLAELDRMKAGHYGPLAQRAAGRLAAAPEWPFPNAWIGVSVEDQHWADIRVPALLKAEAAIWFLSMEPLVGPVYLAEEWLEPELQAFGANGVRCFPRVDQIIVGGESGPLGDPEVAQLDPAWARDLLAQARKHDVAFFFKQTGSKLAAAWDLTDPKGEDLAELPDDLRVREYPQELIAA